MQSPFIRKTVKCPSCHHPYDQRYFRKNLFLPLNEEPDHFVPEFQWLSDKVQRVHPPYYFVCCCPNCFYADTIEDFSDPWRSDFGPYVVKYHRRITKAGDPMKDALGRGVNYEQIDFQSAQHLHLLALYTQLQPPPDLQDAYKIARLFLRISWLYRENPLGEAPAHAVTPEPLLPRISPRAEALARMLDSTDRLGEGLRGIVEELVEVRSATAQAKGGDAERDRALETLGQHLESLLRESAKTVGTIRQLAETGGQAESAVEVATPEPETPSAEPMDAKEHRAWLEGLRSQWPDIPLSEGDATRAAIRWFRQAIEQDSRLDSHESFASVGAIVAHLHGRLGEYEMALDMVNGIHRSALDTRGNCMERQRMETDMPHAEKKRLDARMARLGTNIEDLVDVRDEIIQQLYERDEARITEILAATKGKPLKAREDALLAAKIRNEVITRLKRRGGPLAAAH